MISIKDIGIGDYFKVNRDGLCIKKGTIVEVRGIDADNVLKNHIGSVSCHPFGEEQFDGGIWCDFLDPIPITPEILEKNGFTVEWDEDVKLMVSGMIRIEIGNNYKRFSDGKMFFRGVLAPIYYVHQLQHALRICGIEKTIEL